MTATDRASFDLALLGSTATSSALVKRRCTATDRLFEANEPELRLFAFVTLRYGEALGRMPESLRSTCEDRIRSSA